MGHKKTRLVAPLYGQPHAVRAANPCLYACRSLSWLIWLPRGLISSSFFLKKWSQLHSAIAAVLMFQAHDFPICLNLFLSGKCIVFFALYGDNLHCWCISFPTLSLWFFSLAEGTSVFFSNVNLGVAEHLISFCLLSSMLSFIFAKVVKNSHGYRSVYTPCFASLPCH